MAALPWLCRSCRSSQWTWTRQKELFRWKRSIVSNSRFFKVSEEVQQAVAEKRPVVALESTIYTHGIPHPGNLLLAAKLESLIRIHGAVPATIGILEGVARVGLTADELVRLVSSSGTESILKVSRRDLGFALGLESSSRKPFNGGTTVAGTMILARLAGIKIFATGGLGGVHRGVEETMDVSADLTELGRTPVAVISSGCKSFLDIPRTLEYLETQGVAVATFADGRHGKVEFPAFWSRDSGVRSPMVLRDETDAARVVHAHECLQLQSGFLFANPIPEEHSIPTAHMEAAISQAIEEAKASGATGAASTPYILEKIRDLTDGNTLSANKALVEANVVRGTKVAVALAALQKSSTKEAEVPTSLGVTITGPAAANFTAEGVSPGLANSARNSTSTPPHEPCPRKTTADVFVAGSLAVDLACDYHPLAGSPDDTPELHTSNPARIAQSLGGVGHNIARAAHLLGANVQLCSAVGADLAGAAALDALAAANMSRAGVATLPGARTAQYVAVNDRRKDLVLAMADMSILEPAAHATTAAAAADPLAAALSDFWLPQLTSSPSSAAPPPPTHLVLDANWAPPSLARWLAASTARPSPPTTLFEPVSASKSARLFAPPTAAHTLGVFPAPSVHVATPNARELAAMHARAHSAGYFARQDWWRVVDAFGIPAGGARAELARASSGALVDAGVPQQALQLLPFIPALAVTLGPRGVLLAQILPAGDERLRPGHAAAAHVVSRCTNGSEDEVGVGGVYVRLFPAAEQVGADELVSVNGAGDTFAGALVAGLVKRGTGARVEELVEVAQRAAVMTLKSAEAVSPGLGSLSALL